MGGAGSNACCQCSRAQPEVAVDSRPALPQQSEGLKHRSLDSREAQAVAKAGSATGDDGSFKQLKRVESRDEMDFARQWAVAERLVAALNINAGDAEKEALRSQSQREVKKSCYINMTEEGRFPLNFPITFTEAEVLRFHYIKHGDSQTLAGPTALELLKQFIFRHGELRHKALVEAPMPPRSSPPGKFIVVGDTHGQLQDVLHIFQTHGAPTASNAYLFNGDIADRGPNACEIFFLLFAYFLADPASMYINRGNHENEDMNALEMECGGGFFSEVLRKYDHAMYWQFVDMMKLLPLCTIVGGRIFVVHGGLTRDLDLTLDRIREIDYSAHTVPHPPADELEEVWTDLLWSDPMDQPSWELSHRGVGIKFGPDVTERFLRNNPPLQLVIRSHQLPEDQRGFMYQEPVGQSRCVTIFSASNYCGDSGNHGAVLVFNSNNFPEYEIHEHFAPLLSDLARLSVRPKGEWREAGKALKEREKLQHEQSRERKELNKMMVAIVEQKPAIWSHFLDTTGGAPLVDFDTWVGIMAHVIGTDWRWEFAWRVWGLGDDDEHVNFREFLERFTVTMPRNDISAFKFKIITAVYESILHSHASLQETLRLFDKDGDGMVDIKEMRKVLRDFDLSLSRAQLDSLLQSIFVDSPSDTAGLPKISVEEFLGRFTMVYKTAADALSASKGTSREEQIAMDALRKMGRLIAATSYEDLGINKINTLRKTKASTRRQTEAGATLAIKIESVFQSLDDNDSGLLEIEEFVKGMAKVPGVFDIELCNGAGKLTEELLRKLATKVIGRSGRISILELLEAFCFDEGASAHDMQDALAEHILAVLFRYRQALRAGARCLDPNLSGRMSKGDFERLLRALNAAMADSEGESKLLEAQITDFCEALSRDGKVFYEDLFESFEVIDSSSLAGDGARLVEKSD